MASHVIYNTTNSRYTTNYTLERCTGQHCSRQPFRWCGFMHRGHRGGISSAAELSVTRSGSTDGHLQAALADSRIARWLCYQLPSCSRTQDLSEETTQMRFTMDVEVIGAQVSTFMILPFSSMYFPSLYFCDSSTALTCSQCRQLILSAVEMQSQAAYLTTETDSRISSRLQCYMTCSGCPQRSAAP